MSSAVPSAALNQPTLRSPFFWARAHVVQIAHDHEAVGVVGEVFEPLAHLPGVLSGGAQAHGLDRGDALRGEQVLGVDHAHQERSRNACVAANRTVVLQDREAGLVGVRMHAAAGRHQGQAEHAVVVDDEAAQEQVADFLDAERLGLGGMAARAEIVVEETLAHGRVAVVDEGVVVDEGRDRQDLDPVLVQEVAGEVAGRIHHDADAHSTSSAAASCACSLNDRSARTSGLSQH